MKNKFLIVALLILIAFGSSLSTYFYCQHDSRSDFDKLGNVYYKLEGVSAIIQLGMNSLNYSISKNDDNLVIYQKAKDLKTNISDARSLMTFKSPIISNSKVRNLANEAQKQCAEAIGFADKYTDIVIKIANKNDFSPKNIQDLKSNYAEYLYYLKSCSNNLDNASLLVGNTHVIAFKSQHAEEDKLD